MVVEGHMIKGVAKRGGLGVRCSAVPSDVLRSSSFLESRSPLLVSSLPCQRHVMKYQEPRSTIWMAEGSELVALK